MTEQALAVRDEMFVDSAKVKDLAERYAEFLPGSKNIPLDTRLAMAQIALAHHFDPFLGDIWPIPERRKVNGEWVTSGYRIMIGITAWRRVAHETNEYWGRRFEKCTDEERKWLGAGPNDLAVKCIVMRRKTGQQPTEFDGYGVFHQGDSSKMNPLQCVRLRAERDALKGAFPVGFGGGTIKIGVADDNGDEINGDIQHGPKWELVKDQDEPDTLDELTKIVERDAITNEPKPEEKERKTYRVARLSFDGMKPDQWHALADKFCYDNPNWLKDGKPDFNHVLASAGQAGYETITADNINDVFDAIVGLHAQKAQA